MLDDYYKILNIKNDASSYKIASHYKLLACEYLKSPKDTKNIKLKFYKINSAFEILRNEQIRKYYDILHKIIIQKKHTNISENTIKTYLLIIDNYIDKGKARAEKIIKDDNNILSFSIKRSIIISFLIETIKLYSYYNRFILSPFAGFCILISGFIITLRDILGITTDLWFIGICLLIFGIISIYSNFRVFTIVLMNKE